MRMVEIVTGVWINPAHVTQVSYSGNPDADDVWVSIYGFDGRTLHNKKTHRSNARAVAASYVEKLVAED